MKEKIALVSILINILLTVGKITAGILTGSSAVLAEGLHSFMDIFASAVGFAGISISKKPEDTKHPYGYYKFEVMAGVVITILLFVSGMAIIHEAYLGIMNPQKIKSDYVAYAVMGLSAVINGIISRVKINIGKKENSLALISDGIHSQVDLFVSLAVIGGLFVSRYWIYADAVFAFLIGVYIIKGSIFLGKEAADSLLDVSAGEEVEEKIRTITVRYGIEAMSVKTQKKGSIITANLIIKLPGLYNIQDAERISDEIKANLIKEIENLVYVVIQIESLALTSSVYKPSFGRRYRWHTAGRVKTALATDKISGPGGYCICQKCGYKIDHQTGITCISLVCPNCKTPLTRKNE